MRLLALSLLLLSTATAQTKVSLAQVKPALKSTSPTLILIMPDGSFQSLSVGTGLQLVQISTVQFELRGIAGSASSVTRNVGVKLGKLSDGSWAPVKPLVGKVIVTTLQVMRNGLIQDDSDYTFDGSNNSVKFIIPAADDDRIALTVDTQ